MRERKPMTRYILTSITFAVFAAAFFVAPGVTPDQPVHHPERSGAMEALEFWSEARRYPDNNIPSDKHYRAFEWARNRALKHKPLPFGATGGWKYIGPTNLSGRMLSLALDTQNDILYAGSASGGLWRFGTNGSAWERVNTGYPVLGVAAIAIDTSNPDLIYIGTGEVYRYAGTAGGLVIRTTRGSYGMGILKSTDRGVSWTKSLDWSYHQERGVQAIRLNPLRSSSVWAATTEGIYRSTDDGSNWTILLPIQMAQDIVIHPLDTLKILVSTGNLGISSAILRSIDGGGTWAQVNPIDFSGKTVFGPDASNPDIVYASIADSTTGVGSLWKTTDFGASWTEMSNNTTNPIYGVQGWYSHTVSVDPTNPSRLFHAGVDGGESIDGGVTFGGALGLYSDNHASLYLPDEPGRLIVANDDGVYINGGLLDPWYPLGTGLGTGQFYNGFSNSASDSLIALGQVQDHIPGYLYDGSDVWPESAVDEVGWTGIDQSNDFIMYAGTRGGGAIRKSTNRGVSFSAAGGGFSGISCWNAPFVVSPSNPNVLYFGRSRIFKSTTGAASWSATNGGLVLDGNPALSMAVSATDPNVVYAGTAPVVTRTHVFRTTDGGTSWTDVTGPLPDRYPLDIAIDPNDPAVVYVAYGGALTGHAFKTTDAGVNWTDVTGTLPDIPVTAFLVDPMNSSVVYLGSDIGVYVSTNGGGSWESFNDGLPEAVLVADLSMTPSNRTLRAATHGNSVWEVKMPSTFPALSGVVPSGGEEWEALTQQTISWTQTLVSDVAIDYSTDDGATWISITPSVPAYPDSLVWTVPPTLTALGRVRVRAVSDTLLAAQSTGTFSISYPGVIIDANEGWNLVSVPLEVPDRSTGTLFPAAMGKTYAYAGAYTAIESLETGPGYWVKLPTSGLLLIDGDSVTVDTIPVLPGWNLIGSVAAPVTGASLVSDPPGLIATPLYSFDGSYSVADTLIPGSGHWVKCSGAGSIILDTAAPSLSAEAAHIRPASVSDPALPPGTGTLRFTDALGRTGRLSVSVHAVDGSAFQLPPLPPAGAFDIRFDDGSLLALTDEREHAIRHQGIRFPLKISWNLPSDAAYILSTGTDEPVAMNGSGSVELRSATELTLRRGSGESSGLPGGFTLRQNYPNPFNPSTMIGFTIPEAAEGGDDPVAVSLRIYDIGGRLAGTLIEKGLAPGEHSVEWDAGNLPGGVYFCVLRSGEMTRSMKMLLMK